MVDKTAGLVSELHMGAVYLSEIGDADGLEELKLELESLAGEASERAADYNGLLESFSLLG